ncbi:MAG: hypothetical protein NVSMB25_07300 [Thermoleophilaceae bacterium]
MSIQSVMTRIQAIETAFVPPPPPPAAAARGFSNALQQATGAGPGIGVPGTASIAGPGSSLGQRMVQIASAEVGQAEQPPGSNDSPRIAQYRTATAGAAAGAPWCSYFTSWVARQAGAPVGDGGQGIGAVDEMRSWAQRTGKLLASGQSPAPGDLVLFNEHIGIVESVLPGGRLQTIEGNYSDRVSRNVRPASDALGFIRLG